MQTVTMDDTGKIYLPAAVREKMRERTYVVVVLPDGTIMLHKAKKITDPKQALKEFQTLPKVKKPISKIRKEIEEEAVRRIK